MREDERHLMVRYQWTPRMLRRHMHAYGNRSIVMRISSKAFPNLPMMERVSYSSYTFHDIEPFLSEEMKEAFRLVNCKSWKYLWFWFDGPDTIKITLYAYADRSSNRELFPPAVEMIHRLQALNIRVNVE